MDGYVVIELLSCNQFAVTISEHFNSRTEFACTKGLSGIWFVMLNHKELVIYETVVFFYCLSVWQHFFPCGDNWIVYTENIFYFL